MHDLAQCDVAEVLSAECIDGLKKLFRRSPGANPVGIDHTAIAAVGCSGEPQKNGKQRHSNNADDTRKTRGKGGRPNARMGDHASRNDQITLLVQNQASLSRATECNRTRFVCCFALCADKTITASPEKF